MIWESYPLSSYAKVRTTFVDGEVVFDLEKDHEMRERMAAEKAELRALLGEGEAVDSDARGEMASTPGKGNDR